MSDPTAIGQPVLLNMDDVRVDPVVALKTPAAVSSRREMLPFIRWQGAIHVACANLSDVGGLAALQRFYDLPLKPEAAEPQSLKRAIQRLYSVSKPATAAPARPGVAGEAPDASNLTDEVLNAAILRQASDIHIDPGPEQVRIRFRCDGMLEDIQLLPMAAFSGLMNRFKVLSRMDISEKRAPQDGALRHPIGTDGRTVDIRVATLPTKWGERMTLRLLGLQTGSLTLERLGMSERHLKEFEAALAQPHGMILLTGPTGSGKSTTLYAGLRRLLGQEALNIITLEDPVEYDISGVAQVEVDTADKTSFGKALRSVLRHDPDVVMIGEIRDGETADIAVKASLTGHLVLSSLHTNSASGAVTRLGDMGVQRYLIASTLRLSVAQRLVRRLCSRCRKEIVLSDGDARSLGRPGAAGSRGYVSGGCLYCGGRGMAGRVGSFEQLSLDESWADIIARGAQETELTQEMRKRGIPAMVEDALEKLAAGVTSVEEVRRAIANW